VRYADYVHFGCILMASSELQQCSTLEAMSSIGHWKLSVDLLMVRSNSFIEDVVLSISPFLGHEICVRTFRLLLLLAIRCLIPSQTHGRIDTVGQLFFS
jgi:hypothetical protein